MLQNSLSYANNLSYRRATGVTTTPLFYSVTTPSNSTNLSTFRASSLSTYCTPTALLSAIGRTIMLKWSYKASSYNSNKDSEDNHDTLNSCSNVLT